MHGPHLRLVPPDGDRPSPTPVAGSALLALDELLAAGPPLPDDACARLAALAALVPGRQRAAAALLGATATGAAVDALLALAARPTDDARPAPGVLEALTRCFARGVTRRFPPLALVDPAATYLSEGTAPTDAPPDLSARTAPTPTPAGPRLPPRRPGAPPLAADGPADPIDAPRVLALDFRSSRTRSFPDLVRRAQAVADVARACAAFETLTVAERPGDRHHYRLSIWHGRAPAAAVSAALRAAHLDLTWLHARLVRLRGTRLWLSGWSFADDHPIGPAAQAHLLQAWLRWAEQEPAP